MIIKIKGMVCRHCIQAVTDLLVSAGLICIKIPVAYKIVRDRYPKCILCPL